MEASERASMYFNNEVISRAEKKFWFYFDIFYTIDIKKAVHHATVMMLPVFHSHRSHPYLRDGDLMDHDVTEYTHHENLTKLDNFQLWCHRENGYCFSSFSAFSHCSLTIQLSEMCSHSVWVYLFMWENVYARPLVFRREWTFVRCGEKLKMFFFSSLLFRQKSNEIIVTHTFSQLTYQNDITYLRCSCVCVYNIRCLVLFQKLLQMCGQSSTHAFSHIFRTNKQTSK